jgi:hypothetical protein
MSRPDEDTLELTLARRLSDVVAGEAATEGELRLLAEHGDAQRRALEASLRASEERLGALAFDPGAAVAEMASELRRAERLRVELSALRVRLERLEGRSRELRGGWLRQR